MCKFLNTTEYFNQTYLNFSICFHLIALYVVLLLLTSLDTIKMFFITL